MLVFKYKHRLFPILLLLLCMVCSSCHHDDMEYGVDFSIMPNLGKKFIPFSEQDYEFSEQDSTEKNMLAPRRASSIDGVGLVRGLTESLTAYRVHQVSGTYLSDDGFGSDIPLSGAVYYPKKGKIKGIIVSCHYTVCADYEVPSQSCLMDAWWATKGYAVLMPDYMGYGSSKQYIHPYMQGELTAKHIIDMILAVRSFFAERELVITSSDIILAGYSQGAHAVLQALRMIENHEEYPQYADAQIKVRKCIAGDGIYSISTYYNRCVLRNYIPIPCAVPMLVLGMNVGNTKPLDIEFFFSEMTMQNYEDWILSKRLTLDQLSEIIETTKLNRILSEKACDMNNDTTKLFYQELQRHDIPANFCPKTPIVLFHSREDDVVGIYQAEKMLNQLNAVNANVTTDFGNYGIHGMAYLRYLYKIYKEEL